MKKFIVVMLSIAVAATFAACKKNEVPEVDTTEAETTTGSILDLFDLNGGESTSGGLGDILNSYDKNNKIDSLEGLTATIVEPSFEVAFKISDCENYLGSDVKKTTDDNGRLSKIEKFDGDSLVADITYDYSKNIVDVQYYNKGEAESYEMISFTYTSEGILDTVNHTFPGEAANGLKAEQYKYNPDGTIAYYISPEKINEVLLQAILSGLME